MPYKAIPANTLEEGRELLNAHPHKLMSETPIHTYIRRVYEVKVNGLTEIWVERESTPEAIYPMYQLDQYLGENE